MKSFEESLTFLFAMMEDATISNDCRKNSRLSLYALTNKTINAALVDGSKYSLDKEHIRLFTFLKELESILQHFEAADESGARQCWLLVGPKHSPAQSGVEVCENKCSNQEEHRETVH
jgi:hypothetical protein